MPPLGFLEPLRTLLSHHGDQLQDKMGVMRDTLAGIRANTEAQLAVNQRQRKSVRVPAKAGGKNGEGTLRNDSAYGWMVKWVAVSGEGEAQLFIGTNTADGFMLKLAAQGAERVDWYVPVNGVIFIVNGTEKDCSTNLEVEVLETTAAQGFTGDSGEAIEVKRREQQPPTMPFAPHNV